MTHSTVTDVVQTEPKRKQNKRAVVVAGGTIENPAYYREMFSEEDFILCADSGYRNAQKLGLIPQVVIGDFDSFPEAEAICGEKIVLPTEKDKTDTHECVCYALEHGFGEILLIGAIGSRMDHTLANIHLLKLALDAGASMKMMDEHNEMFLIRTDTVIPRKEGWHFSLLPLEQSKGITLEGFYYPLQNATMEIGNPYGVSNEFAAEKGIVRISKGLLLAVLSRD